MAKTKPDLSISEIAIGLSLEISQEKNPIIIQHTLRNTIDKTKDRRLSDLPIEISYKLSQEINPIIIQQTLQREINKKLN